MTPTHTLNYGNDCIPYRVRSDPLRTSRVAIHVDPDGTVSVDAPPHFSDLAIQRAVQKRARWIVKNVKAARDRFAHVSPREYVSGEAILYLGRRYVLKVVPVENQPHSVRLRGNRLEVETSKKDPSAIRKDIQTWYRKKAEDYFSKKLIEKSQQLPWVSAVPSLQLRKMKRRWGSFSKSGTLTLNLHLVKAPRDCIDYVFVHELAHIKHPNHGKKFLSLVDTYCPNAARSKMKLDAMVEVLMAE